MPEIHGTVYLLGTAMLLGIRHGIEWDHLAAIMDITSTDTIAGSPRGFARVGARTIWLSSLYAIGHGFVVILLGLLVHLFAASMPRWLDPIMERIVGLTLILFGAFVFYSLFQAVKSKKEFKLGSRWMLIFAALLRIYNWLGDIVAQRKRPHRKFTIEWPGPKSAFGIGMLHGIGAETSTQVILFATVGGTANVALGASMLLAFVVGLVVSNSVIALFAAAGFIQAATIRPAYITLGALAGIFSLVVGSYFAFGESGSLPELALFSQAEAAHGKGASHEN